MPNNFISLIFFFVEISFAFTIYTITFFQENKTNTFNEAYAEYALSIAEPQNSEISHSQTPIQKQFSLLTNPGIRIFLNVWKTILMLILIVSGFLLIAELISKFIISRFH